MLFMLQWGPQVLPLEGWRSEVGVVMCLVSRIALCGLNFEEALANDVCSGLQTEDHNRVAEFVVKDVQLIQAKSNYLFAACLIIPYFFVDIYVYHHFEFDVLNDFLVMGKDWRSIKVNSLLRSKSTQKEVQVKAASIKESQTIYRCAAILISLFNMTTMLLYS
ncbi:hypothetical protein QQP08_015350 [Theobroma cacao]|nr:hypothetical protein QQP08_015350 [Theobroma cacao]